MKIKDLVDYIPNSRNTKVIVDNPNHGAAILMAFDKGVEIPEHATNANVIVQLLEGTCEFTLKGEKNVLTEGDILVLAPEDKHSLYAPDRFKVLVTKINA